ncbi:Galanin receptor type 2 [Trichoplax sp. H2]|nr:Galanin receptor type 2 [Trichoplax sp. H2]|eukprot:RDD40845.1 Galanin receptor type 2 [Trichoplax sp. H2]
MDVLQENDSIEANATYEYDPTINIVYALIGSTAIIGNIWVIALNVIHRAMLYQAPNKFVVSLAASDAISGLLIFIMPGYIFPVDSYPYPNGVYLGSIFCSLIDSNALFFASGFISVYTIAIISMERWCAVSRPFLYKRLFTQNRTRLIIICIWIFVPISVVDGVLQKKFDARLFPPCQWFSLFRGDIVSANLVFMVLESIRVFLPALVTIISFADVVRRMSKKSDVKLNCSSAKRVKVRRRFTIMLGIAAVALIICWLPNEIYFSLVQLRLAFYEPIVHSITKTLIVTNCCVNPIIYAATNVTYRRGMIQLIRQISRCITGKKTPIAPINSIRPSRSPTNLTNASAYDLTSL